MTARVVEVLGVRGLAFVEDGGRARRLGMAVPRGGAIDLEALAVANAVVGNAPGAAAIERYGSLELLAHGPLRIGDEEGGLRVLARGERTILSWDRARRARYVTFEGGLDVPSFLGGAGTIVSLGRGGLDGRPLRRGDTLALGPASPVPTSRPSTPGADGPIRVTAGPDLDRLAEDALARFVAHRWRLDPRSDRMGTRLDGPALLHREGTRAVTAPMIEGAIEAPPGGAPIVLGADHPTTGGYPVVAVVARRDLSRFHRIPLGAEVRFALVTAVAARADAVLV